MGERSAVGGARAGVVFAALAAMMAFALVAAGPAFGQATAVNDEDGVNVEDSFNVICPQIITVFGQQNNYDDANAGASGDSEAAAAVAQEFDVSIEQVNQCLSGAGGGDGTASDDQYDDGNGDDTTGDDTTGDDTTGDTTDVTEDDGVIQETIPNQKLPDTGGMPLSGLLVVGFALICAGSAILRGRQE